MKAALDALIRCKGILKDVVRMESSPRAWNDGTVTGVPGPVWEGQQDTHPLLELIQKGIDELQPSKKYVAGDGKVYWKV